MTRSEYEQPLFTHIMEKKSCCDRAFASFFSGSFGKHKVHLDVMVIKKKVHDSCCPLLVIITRSFNRKSRYVPKHCKPTISTALISIHAKLNSQFFDPNFIIRSSGFLLLSRSFSSSQVCPLFLPTFPRLNLFLLLHFTPYTLLRN